MLKVVGLVLLVVIVGFAIFVSTRESQFSYERSGLIQAPPDVIFPYISSLRLGQEWSPYAKADPNMKVTFSGVDGQAGSAMEFEGNGNVGSGKVEILNMIPNESVELKLTMIKPFHVENLIRYTLSREENGTRFTWRMTGENGFIGKLISVLIDCDNMIGSQFSEGIENLKNLIETKKAN